MDWTLLITERLVVTHREHPSGNVSVRGKPCSPSCLSVRALVSGSQSHLLLKTKISTTHYKSVCVCCIGLYYTYFSACLLSYIIELQIYTYFLPNWDAPVLRNKSWAVECVTQHAGNSVEGRDVSFRLLILSRSRAKHAAQVFIVVQLKINFANTQPHLCGRCTRSQCIEYTYAYVKYEI